MWIFSKHLSNGLLLLCLYGWSILKKLIVQIFMTANRKIHNIFQLQCIIHSICSLTKGFSFNQEVYKTTDFLKYVNWPMISHFCSDKIKKKFISIFHNFPQIKMNWVCPEETYFKSVFKNIDKKVIVKIVRTIIYNNFSGNK